MNKQDSIDVYALMNFYSNSLTSTLDAKLITVEGFYQDNRGKLYGKFYYDQILDKDKKSKITIQLTEDLKSKLTSNRYFHFQGYINKAQSLDNDSRLKVYFRATKIIKHEKDVQLISKVEYDIIRERYDREFPIIKDLLIKKIESGLNPSISIITGLDSTAIADYENQLYENEYYDINLYKCNLSSKTEIISLLDSDKLIHSDLIIIIRGGGSGLEVFNDIELSKHFIEQPIPFITGIGHKEDITLLQRVSDKAFATPTSVGVFLQEVIDIYKDNQRLLEEKNIEIQKNVEQFNDKIASINNQMIIKKKKSNKIILGLVILVVVMIIGIYLK